MLEIKDLSLKYENKIIFKNLNLSLQEGKLLLVCGASGSGKSSFLNCAAGIIPDIIKAELSGQIIKKGGATILIQNPHNSTFADNVIEELAFVFENNNMKPDDIFEIVYPLTKKCGIDNILFENIKNISAGQKQKTSLISCISQNTRIIIMDEPFTLLDEAGRQVLNEFIKNLKNEGKILIISEHNISYLDSLIDLILFFDGHSGFEVFDYNRNKFLFQKIERIVRTKKFHQRRTIEYDAKNLALEISDLSYKINEKIIFDKLCLSVHSSNIIGITGANGSGKTTLLKIIAGMITGYSGEIFKTGRVCYIDQDPDKMICADTVENEINFEKQYSSVLIDDILNRLNIAHLRNSNPIDLSIGEKHRVSLAAGIIGLPDYLLIDEPAAGLDIENLECYFSVLEHYAKNKKTVITALTDYDISERYCSKIYKIEKKNIIEI